MVGTSEAGQRGVGEEAVGVRGVSSFLLLQNWRKEIRSADTSRTSKNREPYDGRRGSNSSTFTIQNLRPCNRVFQVSERWRREGTNSGPGLVLEIGRAHV